MGAIANDRILQLRGEDLYDSDGETIGSVEGICSTTPAGGLTAHEPTV
jgi:hypothetical protein